MKVVSDTNEVGVEDMCELSNQIGWSRIIVYIDCSWFQIPQTRMSPIAFCFNTTRASQVFELSYAGAKELVSEIGQRIAETLYALKRHFAPRDMVGLDSFMLRSTHVAVDRTLAYRECQDRSYDRGFKWKEPDKDDSHPRFFQLRKELQYNFFDVDSEHIPLEERFSRSWSFLTFRERSCLVAISTLATSRGAKFSTRASDPSADLNISKATVESEHNTHPRAFSSKLQQRTTTVGFCLKHFACWSCRAPSVASHFACLPATLPCRTSIALRRDQTDAQLIALKVYVRDVRRQGVAPPSLLSARLHLSLYSIARAFNHMQRCIVRVEVGRVRGPCNIGFHD